LPEVPPSDRKPGKCFGYFKAVQSLTEDLNILLVKLDIEKTRLLIWGNAVGILKIDDSE
jgi:hypothetical protein